MAGGHVTSGSSSVVVGQTVNAQVTLDLAPPLAYYLDADEFIINSTHYNKDTQQFLQVQGVTASASVYLGHRAGATGNQAFNWIYNIHPTQQLWSGNQGTRFYVHFNDYLTAGFDIKVIEIEWGYEPSTGKGFIQVWDSTGTKIGEVQVTGYIPSGKQIYVQSLTGGFYVWYDGAVLATGTYPSGIISPFRVKYGVYKIGGQPSSITWPAGHPAQSAGYPGWIFNEATLQGNWKPYAPVWTLQALNASDVQIGSNYNPSSIGETSDIPTASFVVPTVAGIAKIRLRAQFHNISSSALGTPYLDIPVGSGGSTPLAVDGPNPVTLNPGQTYTVTANYPTSELTFAALGGAGSFGSGASANVYTAPADYGTSSTYQFRVTRTATSEQVTVGVNVPLRITPDVVSMVGGTTQVFTTNGDIASWSASGGSLSGSAARSRTFTAPTTVGTYAVTANHAGGASTVATVTVTSSGTTPTTGLRLDPAAGYSVALNAQPQVRLIGDLSPALWATVQNCFIDSATGDLKIGTNNAAMSATLAQALDWSGAGDSIWEWTLNSTQQQTAGDTGQFGWQFRGANEGSLANIYLAYNGTGENWIITAYVGSTQIFSPIAFTRTDTTGIRIEMIKTSQRVDIKFRASSAGSYTLLGSFNWSLANPPKYLTAFFVPSVPSKSSNTIVFSKPTIVQGFGRWYPPNWQASRVDAGGNILGSYPVTTSEESTLTDGNAARVATVNCNAVGTARVRASYPSGIAAQNDVFITITASGTALAVTTPAAGTTTDIAVGGTLTVEANDSPTALTYSCPGGTFGTGASKNVFTAGATAGIYTLTVSRGAEVVTRQIRVLMRVSPATQSVPPSASVTLSVNTTSSISYSATGGTVSVLGVSGGNTLLTYNAPATPGTYTVNVTSSINNASATVTVVGSGTSPIAITNVEPISVEGGSVTQITTNYPTSEVTFTATGGTFGRLGKNLWEAPTQAGNYTITVTHPVGGNDSTVIEVLLRIFPKNPPAIVPGNQIQFSANYSTLSWSISSSAGGAINAQGLWTAGNTAGSYTITVTAVIGGVTKTDSSTVTISGPGLALNQPSAVTLLPTAQLAITANYPTSELTFSATGGSFGTGPTANVYTAPNDAGTYTITVTRGTQTANIVVTVPVVLSPANPSIAGGATQVFTANADVTSFATTGWTATGGTLSSKAIRTVTYTAGSTAGTYSIQAITALGTVTSTITNTGTSGVPIVITGPDALTLEPSSTHLIEVNKPAGSYSLSATGGTFEGNLYRAPQQAGSYTVTVTDTSGSGAGSDTLTVTVPLRVTPANAQVLPGVSQQYSVNFPMQNVSWSVSGGPGGIGQGAGSITVGGLWSGTITPGTYTITATTPTLGSASTSVTVITLELVIYGPSRITLEPSSKYTVLTNYASRNLVYTAFGGSFLTNIYTAPAEAGEYYFTVSVPGQTKRVDVTVPVRISPQEVRLEAGESHQFTINAPSATWSVQPDGAGTISQTGFYTAPTTGGTIAHITATTPSGSDTATVLLLDEFPYGPSYVVLFEDTRTAVIVESEDGTRYGRVKGPARLTYELKFQNRTKTEIDAARAFWRARFPERPFLFHDNKMAGFVAVVFDSAFKGEIAGDCLYAYSFRIRES